MDRRLASYYRRREKEKLLLKAEKLEIFLAKYPKWEQVKCSLKPSHRELLEKLHGFTPKYITIADIAKDKGVSRQAISESHRWAINALAKAISKM
jgi:hypothetical protein